MRCSSAMPAGTLTSSVLRTAFRPRPEQALQGSVGTRPSPPHTSQTCSRTSCPNAVRVTARTRPAPWQLRQVWTSEPGSALVPLQRSQASTRS